MMSLRGKVAIVTGGSRGIGRQICLAYGEAGAQVVVASRTVSDISADSQWPKYASGDINDTARAIAIAGGEALPVQCDVTSAEDLRRLVSETLQHFGRIDVVVSNAGIDCESPVTELDEDLLDRAMATNIPRPGPAVQIRPARDDLPKERGIDFLHYLRGVHRLPAGAGGLLDDQGGAGPGLHQPGRGGPGA